MFSLNSPRAMRISPRSRIRFILPRSLLASSTSSTLSTVPSSRRTKGPSIPETGATAPAFPGPSSLS